MSGPYDAEVTQLADDAEGWLQDTSDALGDDFAGAWLDSTGDGRVYLGFAGRKAVERARQDSRLAMFLNDPRFSFVELKYSLKDLEQAIERVAQRLNAMLASPPPAEGESWPFVASVNVQDNVVDVEIDNSQARRRRQIERTLASDLATRLVRICYTSVQQVVNY